MALFANSSASGQTASVTSGSSILVFNTSASGLVTGATLPEILVTNTGTVSCYVGSGTTVTTSTGVLLKAGATLLLTGQSATQGVAAGNLFAITSSGTTTTLSGLASVDPVI